MRRGPGKSPWRARVWREQGTMGTYAEMDPDVRPPEPEQPAPPPVVVLRHGPPQPDDVPSGSVATVMAWVGDDRARAGAALAYEQAQPQPRSTLIASLERLVT